MAKVYLSGKPEGTGSSSSGNAKVYLNGRPAGYKTFEERYRDHIPASPHSVNTDQQEENSSTQAPGINGWDQKTNAQRLQSLFAGEHLGSEAAGGLQLPKGLQNYQNINKSYADHLMSLGGGNGKQVSGESESKSAAGKNGLTDMLISAASGLGYGLERTAAGALGGVEFLTDALTTPVWWALGKATSSNLLAPITGQSVEENPVSKFFTGMAEANLAGSPTQMYEENIEKRYLPSDGQRKIGNIGGAIGGMLPAIATGTAVGSVAGSGITEAAKLAQKVAPYASKAVFGLGAAGGGMNEAYQEGASVEQALIYGAEAGALEVAIESIAGGIPGMPDGMGTELVKRITGSPMASRMLDILGEGGEEALSAVITPYLKRAVYDPNAANASIEEIADAAVTGMMVSGFLQAPGMIGDAVSSRAEQAADAQVSAEPSPVDVKQQAGARPLPDAQQRTRGALPIRDQVDVMPTEGYKIPKLDTPNSVFVDESGLPIPKAKYPSAIRKYMNRLFKGKVLNIGEDGKVYISKSGIEEFSFPARRLDDELRTAKYAAGASLDATLGPAVFLLNTSDDGRHPKATGGWDNYYVMFETDDGVYSGIVKTMRTERGREFYDISEIKRESAQTTRGDNGTSPPPAMPDASFNPSIAETTPEVNNSISMGGGNHSSGGREAAGTGNVGVDDNLPGPYNQGGGEKDGREERVYHPGGRLGDPQNDPQGQASESPGGLRGDAGNSNQIRETQGGGRQVYLEDSRGQRIAPEFSRRLEGTRVVDGDGRPVAVEHFTPNMEFETFGEGDTGFHFGTREQAQGRAAQKGGQGRVIRAYLNIQSPIRVASDIMNWKANALATRLYADDILSFEEYGRILDLSYEGLSYNSPAAVELRRLLREKGYDGIVYPNGYEGDGDSYIALYPEQVVIFDDGRRTGQAASFGPNTVGAAESAFPRRTRTSQFRTNTVENTPMFTEAEKNTGFLNNMDSDFTYDVVSERQSLYEAAQRVAMDYEGEKAELPGKTIFDGTDTDTAMLILERMTQEARRTGDYSEVKSWMKMIQERGTEAGQRIQAFAKYSRTPEGTLVKAERYVQNAFEKWARENPNLAKAMDEAAGYLQQIADQYARELPADPDAAVRNLQRGIDQIAKKQGLDDSFSKTILEMIQDGRMNKDAASELLRLADGIPTLTTEDVGNILEIMAEAEKLPENSGERLAMESRAYKIVADKFQSSWLDMWNGWRYLAMLGNPTTHLKNRLGNTGFRAVTYAKDALGAALESGADKISLAMGGDGIQRTKAVLNPFSGPDKMLYDAAGNDFESIRGIAMGGGKYNPANMIRDNMTIFRTPGSWGTAESSPQAVKAMRGLTDSLTGLLEKARIKNMDALEAADAVGVKKKYAQALAGYLKANLRGAGVFNSTEAGDVALLDEARAYAIREAQKATFREYNAVAKKLNELKHINSKTEVIGEGLLPFTKTPANILNRAVEYSPVGLANAILSDSAAVKAGRMTAAEMIDHLASGLTGTGIMLLGALLKSLGILTSSGDDDDKKRSFEEMQGAQEYALNVGGYTYTIDWAAPAVIPLFVGAELVKAGEEGGSGITLKNLLDASSKMLDPVVEMSMLKGINDAIRGAAYGGSTPVANIATGAITGYFGQGVPTLLGKVARTVDGTRRRTYADPDSPLPEWIAKPLQKAQAKLPFASSGLQPYVDQWGREQENTGGSFLGRLAYNMLSPGYLERVESTPVDEELEKLYEATGDGALLPGYAPKSFSYGGEQVRMSGDEYTRYAKTRGQTAYSTLEDLFGSRGYGQASEEQKTDMVDAAYSYATYLAKKEILGDGYSPGDRSAKIDSARREADIDPAEAILYFGSADRDGSGSITQEEAKRYLDGSGLTTKQKSYLFALTNSGWKSNPYR